jgi:hypothetical protein
MTGRARRTGRSNGREHEREEVPTLNRTEPSTDRATVEDFSPWSGFLDHVPWENSRHPGSSMTVRARQDAATGDSPNTARRCAARESVTESSHHAVAEARHKTDRGSQDQHTGKMPQRLTHCTMAGMGPTLRIDPPCRPLSISNREPEARQPCFAELLPGHERCWVPPSGGDPGGR